MANSPPLSRGTHGAMIVLLCFLIEALTLSSRSFFAVAITQFEKQFDLTRTAVSACRSVQLVTQAFATPVGGQLADNYPRTALCGGLAICGASLILSSLAASSWQFFLTYGLLSGIGYGATNYNVAAAMLTRVVPERRRGIATGIATSGSPVGQMFLVPVFERVMQKHGWRPGFAVTGGIMLLLVVFAFLVLDMRLSGVVDEGGEQQQQQEEGGGEEEEEEEEEEEKMAGGPGAEATTAAVAVREGEGASGTDAGAALVRFRAKLRRLLTARWFWMLALPFFICGVTAVGVVETHLFALVVDRGISSAHAAWSFGVLMLANGVGIIVSGALSDVASRTAVLAGIFLIRALTFVLLRFSGADLGLLFTFAVVFGFVDYGVVPPTVGLVGHHAGDESLGLGFGVLLALHSAGAAVGAIAAGVVYDAEPPLGGRYGSSVLACAVLCVVAGVIAAALNETPLWRGQMQLDEKERAIPAQANVFGNDGKPGSRPVTEVALESEL